jgi:hypothetical protein
MEDPKATEETTEFHPRGTALILGIFLVLIVLLWATVYLILLSRGVTL